MNHQHAPQPGGIGSFLRSRTSLVFIAFLAIATFYLVTEHTAHFFGFLPYGLLLLCPIMHLFMHGGHGGMVARMTKVNLAITASTRRSALREISNDNR